MNNSVCEKNMCTGCMACISVCPQKAINVVDSIQFYNAIIDNQKCIECKKCYSVCQKNGELRLTKPINWYQGWANDTNIRKTSSSGGIAAAITQSFINNGGVVYSCVFDNGEFVFKRAATFKEAELFKGSKYIKSNPLGVYNQILSDLKINTAVLFIGLPCQVAAIKKVIPTKFENKLYLIDLICHGTPSPKVLDYYLKQYQISLKNCKSVGFRKNNTFFVSIDGNSFQNNTNDAYTIGFLNGLFYTHNCYSCSFASEYRISDLCIGDSWGSELPKTESSKGISLMLAINEKGMKLLREADIVLNNVESENAKRNNPQLNYPVAISEKREKYFKMMSKGIKFNFILLKLYPKKYLKQLYKSFIHNVEE